MTEPLSPQPLLDLRAQYESIREEVRAAVDEVLESQYFILGPKVVALEEAVAAHSGVSHGVGVSSGTDALLIALMAEGVGPGDEVICPAYSFFATAGVVSRLGATPVFVDVEPGTLNIDPRRAREAVTARTVALIAVHLYGQVAEMDPLLALAQEHELVLIEDAAQAIGARIGDRAAGSMGHYGCFSFFPSKNLGGCGDGGMVVTNDPERAQRMRILRNHGAEPKYFHELIGGNFRLDAIQAAVLSVKLPYLDDWSRLRNQNAASYRALFQAAGLVADPICRGTCREEPCRPQGVVMPVEAPARDHVYNQFVIRISNRDRVRKSLAAAGVATEVYYPVPFHRQRCFADVPSASGSFPNSDCAAAQTLALPHYPEMTAAQRERVVAGIAEALKEE